MTRLQPMRRLNNAQSKVIAKNILKQNPEGLPEAAIPQVVIAKKIPEYREVVFINGRDPGYPLEFHYSSKTHPLKHYKLLHGHAENLPVEIIEHLEDKSELQYSYRKSVDGHPEMYVSGRKYLYQLRQKPTRAA